MIKYDHRWKTKYYATNGVPLDFVYNGVQYFCVTNTMGDVLGITEANGNLIVQYLYDDWGKLVSIDTADAEGATAYREIAEANPLRYCGYYYDSETGYYYLQSRYYDPEICRFINADSYEFINTLFVFSNNLYAYCSNNPITNFDENGCCFKYKKKICCDNWVYYSSGKQKISQSGINMLKKLEGCRLTAYKASSSERYYTIGYGHYGSDVRKNQKISKTQAEKYLKNDIKKFEKALNKFTKCKRIALRQTQFDACVIDSYQRGQYMWDSTAYDLTKFLLNNHCFYNIKLYSFKSVQNAFTGTKTTNKGLLNRRQREAKLFYYGTYY